MRRWTAWLLVLGLACGSEGGIDSPARPPSSVSFAGSEALLRVQVADDNVERRRGLMGVQELPADHGMAFSWDQPVTATFWMKNTLIPLAIAFVDDEGRIVSIREMAPCDADLCPRYGAGGSYVLAVEANAGWFAEHGIEVGDRAKLRIVACG